VTTDRYRNKKKKEEKLSQISLNKKKRRSVRVFLSPLVGEHKYTRISVRKGVLACFLGGDFIRKEAGFEQHPDTRNHAGKGNHKPHPKEVKKRGGNRRAFRPRVTGKQAVFSSEKVQCNSCPKGRGGSCYSTEKGDA